jgi:type IV secretion system protein VirB4
MPEARWLDDGETLTYLHSTVSTKRQRWGPDVPMHLDALLADEALTGGLEPKLGEHHLRTLTLNGLPGSTFPGCSTISTARPSPIAGRPGRSCSTRPTRRSC